ncbi:creatinine amidohydrolase [Isoptericola jiangsuensis]|uniref:Creatinine amidohydrolase n=1 Tax=Isoptericola jiangsuensis TaxID=548579 RepID=A0A2A9EUP7_9MICO|nr:creatininase family protein [Isoptericola jiangsuensis]PFG41879.1 creatinine amidohydrolase [Isoptericola jiangsuensis]
MGARVPGAPAVPRFLDMTWPEVAALPAGTVAVLPLGAVEQHGPHLPVSTDLVTASEVSAAAVEAVTQAGTASLVLLEPLAYTKSDEHAGFPGTVWLSWDTLMRVLVDVGRSLAASGIERLVFVNGHGGNSALGQVANRELRRRFGLRTFFAHVSTPRDQGGAPVAAGEHGLGVHGGHSETSLMLHLRPELVHLDLAERRVPEDLLVHERIGFGKPVSFGWLSSDFGPDGHVGDPTTATAEQGKVLFEHAVAELAATLVEASTFTTPADGAAGLDPRDRG